MTPGNREFMTDIESEAANPYPPYPDIDDDQPPHLYRKPTLRPTAHDLLDAETIESLPHVRSPMRAPFLIDLSRR